MSGVNSLSCVTMSVCVVFTPDPLGTGAELGWYHYFAPVPSEIRCCASHPPAPEWLHVLGPAVVAPQGAGKTCRLLDSSEPQNLSLHFTEILRTECPGAGEAGNVALLCLQGTLLCVPSPSPRGLHCVISRACPSSCLQSGVPRSDVPHCPHTLLWTQAEPLQPERRGAADPATGGRVLGGIVSGTRQPCQSVTRTNRIF